MQVILAFRNACKIACHIKNGKGANRTLNTCLRWDLKTTVQKAAQMEGMPSPRTTFDFFSKLHGAFKATLGRIEFPMNQHIGTAWLLRNKFAAHEVRHASQFAAAYRYFIGTQGREKGLENFKKLLLEFNKNGGISWTLEELNKKLNLRFYEEVLKAKGVITQGSKEAKYAEKMIEGISEYRPLEVTTDQIQKGGRKIRKILKEYGKQTIETDANKAAERFCRIV